MGPLLYLTLCSLRNRMRRRLKRLKEPRYLIGMVVGLAYFWMFFWRPRGPRPNSGVAAMSGAGLSIELAAAAGLFALIAMAWLWPSKKRGALAFYRSDVQFLFPAPLTRKELIRYAVFRSQLGVLIGSLFMTLFFRASSRAGGWTFFIGTSFALAILNLHLTGVSLRRESLSSHGVAGIARQWLPVAVVGVAAIIIVGTVALDWNTLASQAHASDVGAELSRLATSGAAGIVLMPFRAVTRLPVAQSPAAFLRALPWALLIFILNYFWVIRSDAQFEEASAEFAEKIARIRKGQLAAPKVRSGTTPTPFKLSLEGPPETAILWKNLIMVGRYLSLRTLILFLPLFVMFGVVLVSGSRGGLGAAFGGMSVLVFIFTILLGPQIARNDLRRDLANLAVLKTWPVSGAALVRGEVMAPAVLLTVIASLCALNGVIFAASIRMSASSAIAAGVLAPGLILLQLLAQNALAVLWPSWFATGAQVRGIDVMGQRLLMMLGLLLVLVVAAVPAGIVAGVLLLGIYFLTGTYAVVAPALAAAAVLLTEAFAASHAIGKLLDRTDVSAIDVME